MVLHLHAPQVSHLCYSAYVVFLFLPLLSFRVRKHAPGLGRVLEHVIPEGTLIGPILDPR